MKLGSRVSLVGFVAIVAVNAVIGQRVAAVSLADCEIVFGNSVTPAARLMYLRCLNEALGQQSSPTPPASPPMRSQPSEAERLTNEAERLPTMYSQGRAIGNGIRAYQPGDTTFYVTTQRADDGSLVYYARINSDRTRILRYNASNQAAGYNEIWEYVTRGPRAGYLNCRVNILSKNGEMLNEPEQIVVETNDMYEAIEVLLR